MAVFLKKQISIPIEVYTNYIPQQSSYKQFINFQLSVNQL